MSEGLGCFKGFRVQGFRVQGFRVQGLGGQALGFRLWVSGFRAGFDCTAQIRHALGPKYSNLNGCWNLKP